MKTWFIAGGSRGFGLRIARLALAQGANVVAVARRGRLSAGAVAQDYQVAEAAVAAIAAEA